MKKTQSIARVLAVLFASTALYVAAPVLAAEDFTADAPKLLGNLNNAPLSLAEAIAQVAQGKLATQAKFEKEDGKLVLSVYTSEKGKGVDAEHNVLQEHKGEIANNKWTPKTAKFKDVEHFARSAEFHALMSMTNVTLEDVAKKAAAEGKVIWVQPVLKNGKPEFDVGVAKGTAVAQVRYDLITGNKI